LSELAFPAGFLWGAATSAYQVEGGVDLDGRGPSIWDGFGPVDGRVACDHRRLYADDVALMAGVGLRAYRFSIAWPRVQPSGSGQFSQSGLDFYRALVDELLAAGIEPAVTLYHWDLPQALEDAGGWPRRDTAGRFADYAAGVASALGDRVGRWSTVNEPWCASMLGYASGVHAPGRVAPGAAVAAAHHLLLAHGMGVDALRSEARRGAEIAITLNPYPVVTVGSEEADADAARRVDGVANRLWYDAVLRGQYPDDVLDDFTAVTDLAFIRGGDLAQIARPIDALGINYYRRYHVRYGKGASVDSTWPGSVDVELVDPAGPRTAMGWAVEPEGLTEALVRLTDDYDSPPLYVHEAGAAFDSGIEDSDRIDFLDAHVRAAHSALAAGVDLRGFFVWSLLDNFEWAAGYRYRFGLVDVDFATQRRTPRASAHWLAALTRANTLPA
jgi:beta-glucosidase